MSDVQATPAAVAVPASETVPTPAAATETTTAPVVASTEKPAVVDAEEPVPVPAAAVTAAEVAPAAAAAETEEKPVEPVNEGLLGYKAPGLLKQFTFAKKDFWFSDEAVAPASLDLYLRGEKAEISHPVVAWASQTGKGLLFFVKKGETDKTRPAGILPLYEATDLKKSSPHEFSFRLHNQNHTFKASTDAERDGWYHSIEKSIEHGKASKETIRESEAYKAELQKLAPSNTTLSAGGAVVPVSAANPRKSAEFDTATAAATTKPAGSDDEEELKKNKKSRSTSRGVLARLRGKKDELEAKVEEKKEEHELKKEEKHAEKSVETAPAAAATTSTTEAAPATEGPSEIEAAAVAAVVGTEEKPKPSKRGSIFGSLKSGFKSPIKEKEAKDAELKHEAAVSDVAPQLPETATPAAPAIAEPVAPIAAGPADKPETEAVKEAEVITPSREKKNFLSGFLAKRDRSVSPSAPPKDVTETAAAPAVAPATEPAVAAIEPAVETPAVSAAEETKEVKTEEPTSATRRTSVFGGLGRRASKMISRVQSSKKEPVAAETKAEEATETLPVTEDLAAHEATEPVAAEIKPAPVAAPSGTVVAASA